MNWRNFAGSARDFHYADTMQGLLDLAGRHPHAHILVSVGMAGHLTAQDHEGQWRIDSRLDMDHKDYLLVKRGQQGTTLREYLVGTATVGLCH